MWKIFTLFSDQNTPFLVSAMQRGVLKNYFFYWFFGQGFFWDLTTPWGPKSQTIAPLETILPTRTSLTNKAVQRMEQILTQASNLFLTVLYLLQKYHPMLCQNNGIPVPKISYVLQWLFWNVLHGPSVAFFLLKNNPPSTFPAVDWKCSLHEPEQREGTWTVRGREWRWHCYCCFTCMLQSGGIFTKHHVCYQRVQFLFRESRMILDAVVVIVSTLWNNADVWQQF